MTLPDIREGRPLVPDGLPCESPSKSIRRTDDTALALQRRVAELVAMAPTPTVTDPVALAKIARLIVWEVAA